MSQLNMEGGKEPPAKARSMANDKNLNPEVAKRFVGMYEIYVCPGMAADNIVFAQKSNLMLGTWQENQMNEVFILDMQNLDGSQNVRYGARFYLGAQIAVGEDITYWG